MSGPGTGMKAYNPYGNKGQEVAVDGPGPRIRVRLLSVHVCVILVLIISDDLINQ